MRKDPARWSDKEIRDAFVVAYVVGAEESDESEQSDWEFEGWTATAVVLHQPERRVPRRLVRIQKRLHNTPWWPYQWWGFIWDAQLRTGIVMGDDPVDVVRAFEAVPQEEDARQHARKWIAEALAEARTETTIKLGELRDVGYVDVPGIAKRALGYAVRAGPGAFFSP